MKTWFVVKYILITILQIPLCAVIAVCWVGKYACKILSGLLKLFKEITISAVSKA